mgnify:FL=1
MGSINGLKKISATSIQNSGEFILTNQLDPGTAGQVIISAGPNEPALWGNNSATIPNALTMGTSLSLASGNSSFNGSIADTINAANTDTQLNLTAALPVIINNGGGLNREVELQYDSNTLGAGGGALQVLKVPNVLTASSNIIFTNTDDGASASSYDGSQPITIRATDTNTEYTAGTNLNLSGTTFNLDTSITTQTGITFLNNGASTNLTGSNYPNKPTIATNLDLSSSTNIFPHPAGVFDVGGKLRMSINLSNFLPNDDSSYYNLAVEDDFVAATMGTVKPMTSSLEVCGYFIIPEGYTATGARIDLNNSSGTPVSRLTQAYRITTYGGTGYLSLHSWTTGAEATFGTSMVGASDTIMLIKIFTAATTDHIRGGYILLTKN